MKKSKIDREEEINRNLMPIIVWIPIGTKKLKIKANVDGNKVQMRLGEVGLKEARDDYISIDPNLEYENRYVYYRFNPLL